MKKFNELSSKDKVAIVFITLGRDNALKLYKHLKEEEIEEITMSIASMQRVDSNTTNAVMEEFYQKILTEKYVSEGGLNYATDLLEKTYGRPKALELLNKLTSSLQVRPFDSLRNVGGEQLYNIIGNEHPQTIALILSYVSPTIAATVLTQLNPNTQMSVVNSLANIEKANMDYVREIERIVDNKINKIGIDDSANIDGISTIVNILNAVGRGTESRILSELEIKDSDLVDKIKEKMFTFEDIAKLDKIIVQRILKQVDSGDLALALKKCNVEVQEIIFNNISGRMRDVLKEDMEYLSRVRVSDVETAQQKIVSIIRKLQDNGEIEISRGSQEEFI